MTQLRTESTCKSGDTGRVPSGIAIAPDAPAETPKGGSARAFGSRGTRGRDVIAIVGVLMLTAVALGLGSVSQAMAAQTPASLSAEIDFTRADLPASVLKTDGLSYPERWGRWTDGRITRIRFAHMLPQKFVLQLIIVAVYMPNRGLPVKVRIGDTERQFVLSATTVQLDFDLRSPADTIEMELPAPTSPGQPRRKGRPAATGASGLKPFA